VAAGQLGLTGEAQPIFFRNPRKTSIQLLLEAQQHMKYAQTTPLDDGVSYLLVNEINTFMYFDYQESKYMKTELQRTRFVKIESEKVLVRMMHRILKITS
jgi:hypothetical protein